MPKLHVSLELGRQVRIVMLHPKSVGESEKCTKKPWPTRNIIEEVADSPLGGSVAVRAMFCLSME